VYLFIFLDKVIDAFSVIVGKLQWTNDAARAKAIIVDKRMREDWEYRDDYSYQVHIPELQLKYASTLTINDSNEQVLWANISSSDYEKYQLGGTVNIFYCITDPSLFLIEGE
jgi:hypothetical protein